MIRAQRRAPILYWIFEWIIMILFLEFRMSSTRDVSRRFFQNTSSSLYCHSHCSVNHLDGNKWYVGMDTDHLHGVEQHIQNTRIGGPKKTLSTFVTWLDKRSNAVPNTAKSCLQFNSVLFLPQIRKKSRES